MPLLRVAVVAVRASCMVGAVVIEFAAFVMPTVVNVVSDANVGIAVARGSASGPLEVDGISGATRTGNGITNLLRFWLGEYGFGPFLNRLARGEVAS